MFLTIDRPDQGDLAAVLGGGVHDLLHPVHVAGEAGHDDALLGSREDVGQHRPDRALRHHDARHLGVRGVGQQQVNAVGAEPGEPAEVGQPVVQRQLVHLEVAGVQDDPGRRLDRDRERVRDRVVDREELQLPRTEGLLSPPASTSTSTGRDPVLGELGADQRQRQPRPDQRDVGPLPQQVRNAADVVLVRMRQHQRVDLVQPALERGEVRQDQVDAGLVVLGEQDAAVDDEQPAGVLEDRHVAADLAEAAERDQAQAVSGPGAAVPLAPGAGDSLELHTARGKIGPQPLDLRRPSRSTVAAGPVRRAARAGPAPPSS